MTDTRVTKSADQLLIGDWLAPGEMLDGAAEVLHTLAYLGTGGVEHVHLVVREQGARTPYADVVSGGWLTALATTADLAEQRDAAERAQKIADIRALADYLEDNPWMPAPYKMRGQVGLHADDAVTTVRQLADKAGKQIDERLDDRTGFEVTIGQWAELAVIAWHEDGRPAESDPECTCASTEASLMNCPVHGVDGTAE